MDRLAQKGIVTRRKVGRAYLYRANLSADEARAKAVEKIVAGFFDGSADALAAHLAAQGGTTRPFSVSGNGCRLTRPARRSKNQKLSKLDETLL